MEAATASGTSIFQKSEFENRSGGQVGVIVIENGKEKAIPVKPGARILLSRDEQILTANAPAEDKDNPFANESLVMTREASDIGNRRPIGDPGLAGSDSAGPDPEAVAAREKAERSAKEHAEAEAQRQADASKQGPGPKPQPPAKETAKAKAADTEETGNKPEPASDVQGERAAAEEVATPEAAPDEDE